MRYEGIERLATQIRSDFKREIYDAAITSEVVRKSNLILIDRFFLLRSDDELRQLVTQSGDRARLVKLNEMAPPNTTELINLLLGVL